MIDVLISTLVNFPTRVSEATANVPDLFFTSNVATLDPVTRTYSPSDREVTN